MASELKPTTAAESRPTNDDLKAIIAAGEKATPRPWFSRHGPNGVAGIDGPKTAPIDNVIALIAEDADYIALAANHAEAMARELLEARALIEKTVASTDEIDASRARRYLAKCGKQGGSDAS